MCRVQSPGFGETETGKFNLGVLGAPGILAERWSDGVEKSREVQVWCSLEFFISPSRRPPNGFTWSGSQLG